MNIRYKRANPRGRGRFGRNVKWRVVLVGRAGVDLKSIDEVTVLCSADDGIDFSTSSSMHIRIDRDDAAHLDVLISALVALRDSVCDKGAS